MMKKTWLIIALVLFITLACSFVSRTKHTQEPVNTEDINEVESQSGIFIGQTEANGVVSFRDPKTSEIVNVKVVNADSQPLKNMKVVYQHGKNYPYEAFFVEDDKGNVTGLDFFSHNSDHIIISEPNYIHRANPDQIQALLGYVDEMGRTSQDFYQRTITCDEYENVIERAKTFIQISIDIIVTMFGGMENLTGELVIGEPPCTGQWDWYHSVSPYYGGRTEVFVFIRSQSPEMQKVEVEITPNGQIIGSWLASDPTKYTSPKGYKIDTLDHTVFLGPTEFSDLTYYYRILDETGAVRLDWTKTTSNSETLVVVESGNYTLEVYSMDEVNNKSDTKSKQFTFSINPENENPSCAWEKSIIGTWSYKHPDRTDYVTFEAGGVGSSYGIDNNNNKFKEATWKWQCCENGNISSSAGCPGVTISVPNSNTLIWNTDTWTRVSP